MWRPGRRMFTIACILILLTAVLHTIGNWSVNPTGEEEQKVITAMQDFHLQMGMGMEPSFFDLFRALTFVMTVTFLALGAVGLMLSGSRTISTAMVRRLTWSYAIWNGAFTAVCFYYKVPPPLICGIVIELALVIALLPSAANTGQAAAVKV